jgi:hypothetical protein
MVLLQKGLQVGLSVLAPVPDGDDVVCLPFITGADQDSATALALAIIAFSLTHANAGRNWRVIGPADPFAR